MSSFNYTAKDRSGNTVNGIIDASDERLAAAMIREQGYMPVTIKLAHLPGAPKPVSDEAGSALERYLVSPLWTGVNIQQLYFFYNQLATLLAAGMTLSEALRSIGSRSKGRLRRIIDEAQNNVQRGGRLSETMSRYPKVFNNLQISLVRVGEGGGMLEQMINKIASYLEYEMGIRKMIVKATIWPVITLIFALFISICLPYIQILINQGFAPFLKATWPQFRVAFFGSIGTVVILKLLFQFDIVKLMWDSIKIQPPVIGTCARKLAMSRFCRALAVLYSAGMPISESVNAAADACANLAIGRGIKYGVPALQAGQGLTETLTKTRAVTPLVLDMLHTGEQAGNMDAVLQKSADYIDDEADATIHKLSIALFVLMILIAGVIVGMMVIKFWGGYYNDMLKVTG